MPGPLEQVQQGISQLNEVQNASNQLTAATAETSAKLAANQQVKSLAARI